MTRRNCPALLILAWYSLLVLLIPSLALSLTEEEIEAASQRGLAATKLRDVPAFIHLGIRQDRGLTNELNNYEYQNYAFLARSCTHWISNLAFWARETPLDRAAINGKCLGRDWLQVVVAGTETGDPLTYYDPLIYPAPTLPVSSVFLKSGSERLEPIDTSDFHRYGKGNANVFFDLDKALAMRPIWIVARIAWEADFEVKVIPRERRRLFRKKGKDSESEEDTP